MSRFGWILTASLLLTALAAPLAAAHEQYQTDDGMYSLVLGEQGEPVYTYDWTNLDFIVSEDTQNGTGGPVPAVHETVNATLIAPGGEELALPLEPQHGHTGRYQFVSDYYLTQPGQYEVRLEGQINGTSVDGTYLLPGPREAMNDQGFPSDDVPDLLTLQQENQDLRDRVETLETDLAETQSQLEALQDDEQQNGAPGPGVIAAIGALATVAGLSLIPARD